MHSGNHSCGPAGLLVGHRSVVDAVGEGEGGPSPSPAAHTRTRRARLLGKKTMSTTAHGAVRAGTSYPAPQWPGYKRPLHKM